MKSRPRQSAARIRGGLWPDSKLRYGTLAWNCALQYVAVREMDPTTHLALKDKSTDVGAQHSQAFKSLIGLNGETNSLKRKKSSDHRGRRYVPSPDQTDEGFSAHRPLSVWP
jgi:hypothetical protein